MRQLPFALLVLLCWGVAVYAMVMYGGGLPSPGRLHPDMLASFEEHKLGIRTHVLGAMLALLLGPLQFSRRLRARWPLLHRSLGRVYLGVGVGVGGLAGLYMAGFAYGGRLAQLGFALLAMAWLYTGWRAYFAARRRDINSHRRWMMRNFALSCAAVSLRLYLPAGFALQLPFELTYPVIAWLCWVPNLALAEWLLRR